MRKKILIIVIGFGVVLIGGVGYWLIAPLFITKQASETLEDIARQESVQTQPKEVEEMVEQIETIAQGTFVGLAGHRGEGTVSLLKIGDAYYIRFEEDFQTTNGPDLFVHLGQDNEYASEARLSSLKGNVGSQNYKIPESINVNQYNEVWVWCRAFSVPFAKAVFEMP